MILPPRNFLLSLKLSISLSARPRPSLGNPSLFYWHREWLSVRPAITAPNCLATAIFAVGSI